MIVVTTMTVLTFVPIFQQNVECYIAVYARNQNTPFSVEFYKAKATTHTITAVLKGFHHAGPLPLPLQLQCVECNATNLSPCS